MPVGESAHIEYSRTLAAWAMQILKETESQAKRFLGTNAVCSR